MPKQHVVVDGSNIATEGRTFPSLKQLESALIELRKEWPKAEITVVVDATFAHRIDPSERKRFEEAQAKGEYITPPAGAIGRGDAFVLKIAEKVKAVVLSNDSFQEFHGEHAWLFDADRLLGASPVPGVGWIFVPRTPVRGPKSRGAVRGVRSLPPMPEPKTPPPRRGKKAAAEVVPAPVKKERPPRVKVERKSVVSPEPVNDPTTFITFIASHPLGEEIEAEVESFTSHGAIIRFENVQCYAPLAGLGSPPPRSPREVLERGELRTFVIRGLDPQRRGIELALPDLRAKKPDLRAKKPDLRAKKVVHPPVGRSRSKDKGATVTPDKLAMSNGAGATKTRPKSLSATKASATPVSPKMTAATKTVAKKAPVTKAPPKRAGTKAVAPKKSVPTTVAPTKARVAKTVAKKAPVTKAPPKRASTKPPTPKRVAATAPVPKRQPATTTVGKTAAAQATANGDGASASKAAPVRSTRQSTPSKRRTSTSVTDRAHL